MSTKRKTTRELSAEQAAAARRDEVNSAMLTLSRLRGVQETMRQQRKPLLRSVVKAIEDEIDFLLAESDIYRDAAAALYAGKEPEYAITGEAD